MKRRVYRSLDHPATFFGIRGRFMVVMGLGGALALILGLVVGQLTSMLLGFGVILVIAVIFYFVTLSLQSKVDEKDIWKIVARRGYPELYRMRPKHIRNIWQGFNLAGRNLSRE